MLPPKDDNATDPQDAMQEARAKMVRTQLVATGVQKHSIIERMGELEREKFTPEEFKIIAYSAKEIPVSASRYMLDPMNLGLLLDRIDFDSVKTVMVLGDSTGYVAALLAGIIENVVTVDNVKNFTENLNAIITMLNIDNITVIENDIDKGYPAGGAYDLIFINGSIQKSPDDLFAQLSPQGKILTALKKPFISEAVFQYKTNGTIQTERLFECAISLLPEFGKKSKFVF
jgi:protein-L-isoaspartate(D-aspartate) O-methyltransferase